MQMARFDPSGSLHDLRSGYAPLPRDLVRVLDWLKVHISEPVDLAALATIAGVPERTLENHFKLYLRTTPLGWVRRMRLNHARQQLLAEAGTVTEVATASGFSQLGRFSVQYRELFGETPSQTRLRARNGASQAHDEMEDEAMFLAWRALASAYTVAAKECRNALDDVARAEEIAPKYALPKAIGAWCEGQRLAHNFESVRADARDRVAAAAREAAALGRDDSLALNACSGAMALAHRLTEADRLIERAIAIDPWSSLNWVRRGWISAYLGDSASAIRELSTAFYLSPFKPMTHVAYIGIGCAHFAAGRYDRTVRWIREGVDSHPQSFWADRITVAAAAHYGARDESRRIARQLLRKDPGLTVEGARDSLPFTPAMLDRLGDGLKDAGVPYC